MSATQEPQMLSLVLRSARTSVMLSNRSLQRTPAAPAELQRWAGHGHE